MGKAEKQLKTNQLLEAEIEQRMKADELGECGQAEETTKLKRLKMNAGWKH